MDSNKLVQQREPDFDDYDNEKPMRAESGSPSGKFKESSTNEGSDNGIEEGLHGKFLSSKLARKKAEEDAKLLANRISLLKMEEQKAIKKIEETKKRAKEIMQQRQRNEEIIRKKEERQRQKEEEERLKQLQNKMSKESMKEALINGKTNSFLKKKEEAERVKVEKSETRDIMEMQKEQELLKNASIKQMIKNQEKELAEKKKRDFAEKQARSRADLEEKIMKEDDGRRQREAEVARLEEEELELIRKLQNTQLHQEAAYAELENALSSTASMRNTATEFSNSRPASRSQPGSKKASSKSQIEERNL